MCDYKLPLKLVRYIPDKRKKYLIFEMFENICFIIKCSPIKLLKSYKQLQKKNIIPLSNNVLYGNKNVLSMALVKRNFKLDFRHQDNFLQVPNNFRDESCSFYFNLSINIIRFWFDNLLNFFEIKYYFWSKYRKKSHETVTEQFV